MTLPYFDVHWMELAPVAPLRCMPRGNTHRLLTISLFQSIERAVITCPSTPWNTRRVQAALSNVAASAEMPSTMAESCVPKRRRCVIENSLKDGVVSESVWEKFINYLYRLYCLEL